MSTHSPRRTRNIVLVFQSMRYRSGRESIAGIYRYARRRAWQIQCFETVPEPAELRTLLETWKPLGCLVSVALVGKRRPDFGDVPTVYLGRLDGRVLKVEHDARATAQSAVDELARCQPRAWGFFGPAERMRWSSLRRKFYCEAVRARGGSVRAFAYRDRDARSAPEQERLERYLKSLAKPAAVFIAADYLAGIVIDTARRIGLRIPDDLSLVSVDNDTQICENLVPSLTSVEPNFEIGGYAMGELLDRRLANPSLRSETLTYGPLQTVRRASSRPRFGSYRLNQAQEYIRKHVTEGIRVGDVAAYLGCQRRTLERMFRAETGASVLEAITDARLEAVKALLRNRQNLLSGIAARVGFSSEPYVKALFRQRTGLTMSAWRKRLPDD